MTADEIARAHRMGWVSEEEWDEERAAIEGKRKPSRFLTAHQYLEKVEADLPILRERNRFLDDQLRQAEERIAELSELVDDLHQRNKDIAARARNEKRSLAEQVATIAPLNPSSNGYDQDHIKLDLEEEADCAKFMRSIPGCTREDYIELYRRR